MSRPAKPTRARTAAIPFDLSITAATGAEHVAYLRSNLRRAHAIERPALRELSVALVGDKRMADIHQRFMGIAGPTDVITFELDHDARGRVVAGEVVVCVPYALRQARRSGAAVKTELLLYALHGMLHLSGFDDRTARDFGAMHPREDEILRAIGVGAVFAPAGDVRSAPAKRTKGRAGGIRK
jgi:probable rRNA maturation factor